MTDWFGANAYIPHGFCMAWEPDLVAAVPGAGAPPTTLRGQFPTVATP